MRFLSNTYDPTKQDSEQYVHKYFDKSPKEAVRRYRAWLKGKIIGRPQPTETYTVEQLEAMGMVGVYLQENET